MPEYVREKDCYLLTSSSIGGNSSLLGVQPNNNHRYFTQVQHQLFLRDKEEGIITSIRSRSSPGFTFTILLSFRSVQNMRFCGFYSLFMVGTSCMGTYIVPLLPN